MNADVQIGERSSPSLQDLVQVQVQVRTSVKRVRVLVEAGSSS